MIKRKPTIGIIGGAGKMGQWLSYFFQERDFTVLTASRKTTLSPQKLAQKADIVIVSVPIAQTAQTITDIIPHLKKTALLTDVSSLKVMSLEAMRDAPCATLGIHPLFGPSIGNLSDAQIVFCRQKDNAYVDLLKGLFEKAGITVIEISADEHDYQMAYIQAFTHAINLLFGKIILNRKNELLPKLHTPVFSLQTLLAGRVLQQDMHLVSQMQLFNPYFPSILLELEGYVQNLRNAVQKQNEAEYRELFRAERAFGKNFAHFSVFQTNKILQLVNQLPSAIPYVRAIEDAPKEAKVGFLGPVGTYSHQAAITVFPKTANTKIACESLYDLFTKVLNSEIDFAIVPAENSTEGTVRETLDYLVDFSLFVAGSFELPIHHYLLAKHKSLKAITTVVSHAQALAQCKQWLNKHLPSAKKIPSASTTAALQSPKKGYAYIASKVGRENYNLTVLAKNIEDNPRNTTRFYVLSKTQTALIGLTNTKTLLFLTVYNRVGILRDILDVFARHNLNLTKLESRPSRQKVWDYHFFVEVESLPANQSLQLALKGLEIFCPTIRILGVT